MPTLTVINNIGQFNIYNSTNADIIVCQDDSRTSGNHFIWITGPAAIPNFGTIYPGHPGPPGAWKMMFEGPVSVKWFNAKGDGVTDDSLVIQNAINYVATINGSVYLPQGTYRVNTPLRIKQGVKEFYGPGKLLFGVTSTASGVIDIDGSYFGGTPVSNCRISIAEIDANNVASFCIFFAGGNSEIIVHDTICKGINNTTTGTPTYTGIQLNFGCFNNTITNNKIYMAIADPRFSTAGINIIGENRSVIPPNPQTFDGNYFENGGVYVDPSIPNYNNIITNNFIFQGTHGIQLIAGVRNLISGNNCAQQSARSIILGAACTENVIDSNICTFFTSSGIHLAYNCNSNMVSNNYVYSPGSIGEGGIQAYVGCSGNTIQDNYINCGSNYGIYIAITSSGNLISGNSVYGYKMAGIAIESDWNTTLPSGANYSRPHSEPPPFTGYTSHQWPFADCNQNVISNNTIGAGNNNDVAAIYIAAINGLNFVSPFSVVGTILKGNTITASTLLYHCYIFQEGSISANTGPIASGVIMNNNNFQTNDSSKFYFIEGRSHFFEIENNSVINNGIASFPPAVLSPDVSIGYLFFCANTSPANITSFSRGKVGQIITVRLDVFTTIINDPLHIRLKGGVDASGNADNLITFINISIGIWFELSRNF